MRFIPRDTSDLLQLTRLVFSPEKLDLYVAADTVVLEAVPEGAFVYSGVAQRYTPSLLTWRPVGLYTADQGVFQVRGGETTRIGVHVDFSRIPQFPPP